jgi:hypothetical protein
MKVRLMHADRDLPEEPPAQSPQATELAQDLELDTLVRAMAGGDEELAAAGRTGLLAGLGTPEEIAYRREVLADCLRNPEVVRELYALTVETVEREHRIHFSLFHSPESVLGRAVHLLELFIEQLRRLRGLAEVQAREQGFRSPGFTGFFGRIAEELDEPWFGRVDEQLRELLFRRGMVISAGLGRGLQGTGHTLRRTPAAAPVRRLRLPVSGRRSGLTFQVDERERSAASALDELRGRGLNPAADALARSTDHILGFFRTLRRELAFYIGCLNLHQALTGRGGTVVFPEAVAGTAGATGQATKSTGATSATGPALSARGLYDPCLALTLDERSGSRPVGNDLAADGRPLVLVTGANQGGKSTFLRSVGLAQLMMQAGMFVAAESFRSEVRTGLFTHYPRGEDTTMTHGKLEEELARMSGLADRLGPGALLLCNESFASTNEREGSEIARQMIRALLESGVSIVFVTHLFELADGFHQEQEQELGDEQGESDGSAGGGALLLRAERRDDGNRTYRIVPGAPLPTSHGEDLFHRVFTAG